MEDINDQIQFFHNDIIGIKDLSAEDLHKSSRSELEKIEKLPESGNDLSLLSQEHILSQKRQVFEENVKPHQLEGWGEFGQNILNEAANFCSDVLKLFFSQNEEVDKANSQKQQIISEKNEQTREQLLEVSRANSNTTENIELPADVRHHSAKNAPTEEHGGDDLARQVLAIENEDEVTKGLQEQHREGLRELNLSSEDIYKNSISELEKPKELTKLEKTVSLLFQEEKLLDLGFNENVRSRRAKGWGEFAQDIVNEGINFYFGLSEWLFTSLDRSNYQRHHIVSNKNEHTREHPLWRLAGMNSNAPENAIYLPTDARHHPTRTIHTGRHWDSVSERLGQQMNAIEREGQAARWTQEQYRERFENLLNTERTALRSGERSLNKNNRDNDD